MARYIDVDAFRMENRMSERCEDCKSNQKECQYNDFSRRDFCGWLDDAPIVDAAPVKHGHWEDVGSLSCRCSECGCKNYRETRFCPNCGAKMDLEVEHDG